MSAALTSPAATTGSDVSENQAIEMLAACQEHSEYFQDFDFQQLIDLAKALSILYFTQGETILFQGEPATFFGVVLKGAVIPIVGERRIGNPRGTGEVIGETSLFTGGTRNASIVATQDGYLAVFGFAQLDSLFTTNETLAMKLSRQVGSNTGTGHESAPRSPRPPIARADLPFRATLTPCVRFPAAVQLATATIDKQCQMERRRPVTRRPSPLVLAP